LTFETLAEFVSEDQTCKAVKPFTAFYCPGSVLKDFERLSKHDFRKCHGHRREGIKSICNASFFGMRKKYHCPN
jgi:hypothetical protein